MLLSHFLEPNLIDLFAAAIACIPAAWNNYAHAHTFAVLTRACDHPAAAA